MWQCISEFELFLPKMRMLCNECLGNLFVDVCARIRSSLARRKMELVP